MITRVIMPQLSLTMQTGTVTQWMKSVGDKVAAGDALCVVEGDKATIDVESPVDGYLIKAFAELDEEFPVKQPLALIGDSPNLQDYDEEELQDASITAAAKKIKEPDKRVDLSPKNTEHSGQIKASPIAKRLAKEHNIDISLVTGTGPGGVIVKEDVLVFISNQSEDSSPEVRGKTQPLSDLEKVLASKMSLSNQEIPHFHLAIDLDVTKAEALRKQLNDQPELEKHITLTDIFVWVTSRALRKHSRLNATFMDGQIFLYEQVNIGLAVDTPKGLIVVVIKDADKKSLTELADARSEIVARAVDGEQTPDDLSGGTFTITNLGMFGIKSFSPIIVPGQAGILGVGSVQELEKRDEGVFTGIKTINVTLACDHRIVDGVEGAKFLKDVSESFSAPGSWLV